MLNTQKLLYVLPDLAYVAELLPDKKPYSFSIQSFKQINGEFLDETEFKAENMFKLVNKLDEGEEYFLVLPDFLFTNTIISIQETTDVKIKERLTTETLPKLGLKDETHLIETVVLNQLKGTTRVQLSAIEKSVLTVIKVAIAEQNIKITGIAPLSWTVKSLVSLEPSISVLQMGTKLYTAQHYIGVDQTTTASIDQPENSIETIKTLKGAEPSIQTVYLCSNSIVEEKIKESLSKILPIQQMATKDGTEKIPSYISQIIVAGQRTLSIPDYSVPTFKLTKPTTEEKEKYADILTAAGVDATKDDENEVAAEIPKPQISPVPAASDTVDKLEEETAEVSEQPNGTSEEKLPDIEDVAEEEKETPELPNIEDAHTGEAIKEEATELPSILPSSTAISAGAETTTAAGAGQATAVIIPPVVVDDTLSTTAASDETKNEQAQEKVQVNEINNISPELSSKPDTAPKSTTESGQSVATAETAPLTTSVAPPVIVGASQIDIPTVNTATDTDEDTVLKQFAQNGETAVESNNNSKPIIKNKSGAKNMMKMILITTGVFILTVVVGIGVGLAILKYSGDNQPSAPPVVEVEEPTPTPATPEPTPSASASASIDKSALSILVVNATGKAGYAGQIQTKLEGADFEEVSTGNAKGDYADGNYIYMSEANAALQTAIEEATDLELTATESARVEDTQGSYDAVVILAK